MYLLTARVRRKHDDLHLLFCEPRPSMRYGIVLSTLFWWTVTVAGARASVLHALPYALPLLPSLPPIFQPGEAFPNLQGTKHKESRQVHATSAERVSRKTKEETNGLLVELILDDPAALVALADDAALLVPVPVRGGIVVAV